MATSSRTQQHLINAFCLSLIYVLAFVARLHPVLRFEVTIHEFDAYFNLRATQYLVDNGFANFHNWFDPSLWYPLGRPVGFTVHSGLMWTAAALYHALHALGLSVSVRHVCTFLAPWMASNTTLVTYLLGREIADSHTGLLAAAMLAIVPGYISRSVAGSFDPEAVATFAMQVTFYLFAKAVNRGSAGWGGAAAVAYLYMCASWGGYVYVINLLPLYVLVMLVSGKCSSRLYIAYSSFCVIGTILSLQIRFIGFNLVESTEHLLALITLVLLQLWMLHQQLKAFLSAESLARVERLGISVLLGVSTVIVMVVQANGSLSSMANRFYAVINPTYAKEYLPILASVSEHQPTSWASFFFDLHCLMFLLPAGLYYCFRLIKQQDPKSDVLVLAVMMGMSSVYVAAVMVKLMLLLAPAACLLSAITVSSILSTHLPQMLVKPQEPSNSRKSKSEDGQQLASVMIAGVIVMLFFFVFHCNWVSAEAYSSPSIVLSATRNDGSQVLFDDFREAYSWIRHNTPESARILSWWDYGYQLSALANRTTVIDNNTWNITQIATVGKALTANETVAYDILQRLDVDYVVVVFGGLAGYGSDDLNKYMWMVRILSSVDGSINEAEYFTRLGEFRVDSQAPPRFTNSLLYKLSYHQFGSVQTQESGPLGVDRVRGTEIATKKIELEHLEEVFSTEHWIVRVYQVKPPENRWQ
jgi:dolichyl-diphosphooligosaccharide--protein glycosyltransferase